MRTLRTRDLVKNYSKKKVVDHVSIEVHQGEVVGFWDPTARERPRPFT